MRIVEELAKDVKEIVEEVSTSLPVIVKKLESNILSVVDELNINKLFEELKEDIDEASSEDSIQCAQNALDRLDTLHGRIRSDMGACVDEAKKSTVNIKNNVQELMTEATALAQQVSNKIQGCLEIHGEEPAGLSACLESEIASVKELLNKMRKSIKDTVMLVEDLAKNIGSDLSKCLTDAKEDAVERAGKLVNGVKNCKDEL